MLELKSLATIMKKHVIFSCTLLLSTASLEAEPPPPSYST